MARQIQCSGRRTRTATASSPRKKAMMKIIRKLKYMLSEPYRIRIGVGLSPIRNNRELKALIAFCEEELKDKAHMKLNPERKIIYQRTIALYKKEKMGLVANLRDYINDNIGWYWS